MSEQASTSIAHAASSTTGSDTPVTTATPNPSRADRSSPAVLLLKLRQEGKDVDEYEGRLTSSGFEVRFLPPLSFSYPSAALDSLRDILLQGPLGSGIWCVCATSPRGMEGWVRAFVMASEAGMTREQGQQWANIPFFTIGQASAKPLLNHPLMQPYGFKPRYSNDEGWGTDGVALGRFIRSEWEGRKEANASPTRSVLTLSGDTRRDELFQVLAGDGADGKDSQQQHASIPFKPIIIYTSHGETVEGVGEQQGDNNLSLQPSKFIQQLLHHLHSLTPLSSRPNSSIPPCDTAPSSLASSLPPPPRPIYVAFFSPLGVENFFAHLRHHANLLNTQLKLLRLDGSGSGGQYGTTANVQAAMPHCARMGAVFSTWPFRFACIGRTTADALKRITARQPPVIPANASSIDIQTLPAACSACASDSLTIPNSPTVLTAAKPNADELLRCINNDYCALMSRTQSLPASDSSPSPSPISIPVRIPFFKYHGALNDYALLDGFVHHYTRKQLSALAIELCADRRGSIGSDGLLYVTSGREHALTDDPACLRSIDPSRAHMHARMYMFNTDGSEAEMCGNGLRCVAKFAHDHKYRESGLSHLHLMTQVGEKVARIQTDQMGLAQTITLDLGQPQSAPRTHTASLQLGQGSVIQLHCHDVSMGNPHCIILLDDEQNRSALQSLIQSGVGANESKHADSGSASDSASTLPLDCIDVDRIGRAIHDLPRYASSHGCNVTFAQEVTVTESASDCVAALSMRTYERGNGETWACGSGISATVTSYISRHQKQQTDSRAEPEQLSSKAMSLSESFKQKVQVFVRGGELAVTCTWQQTTDSSDDNAGREDGSTGAHDAFSLSLARHVTNVELSGPAVESFQGCFTTTL